MQTQGMLKAFILNCKRHVAFAISTYACMPSVVLINKWGAFKQGAAFSFLFWFMVVNFMSKTLLLR